MAALRKRGHFVAMVGDGANDVHALRAGGHRRGHGIRHVHGEGGGGHHPAQGLVQRADPGHTRSNLRAGQLRPALSKLFVAKSFYAYFLIFATNLLGLEFPFLPRHGALTAMLALGIPAIFISISIPPPSAGKDYLRSVLRFALPASIALAASAMVVQFTVEGLFNQSIEEARTLSALVLGLTGIAFMVEILGFEGASFRSLTRPS